MPGNAPTLPFQISSIVTAFNFLLLMFTALLSYRSYVAQTRTGIRESLEQLDDVQLNGSVKIKPILHRFNFGILDPRTELYIKFYNFGQQPASASSLIDDVGMFHPSRSDDMVEYLNSYCPQVESTELRDDGLIIHVSSRNAVEIRRCTDQIMREIKNLENAISNREIESYLKNDDDDNT